MVGSEIVFMVLLLYYLFKEIAFFMKIYYVMWMD